MTPEPRARAISLATFRCCRARRLSRPCALPQSKPKLFICLPPNCGALSLKYRLVSTTIVNALIMRRRRLKRDREFAGFRALAHNNDRDGHQIDDFLDKNHIPHRLIDAESAHGQETMKRFA